MRCLILAAATCLTTAIVSASLIVVLWRLPADAGLIGGIARVALVVSGAGFLLAALAAGLKVLAARRSSSPPTGLDAETIDAARTIARRLTRVQ